MKKLLLLLVIAGVVSLSVGYYLYNMPAKNLTKVQPDVRVSSNTLMAAFEDDEDQANGVYLGKVIEVNGKISSVDVNDDGSAQIMLESESMMGGISCNFEAVDIENFVPKLKVGQIAVFKGNCTGYLMDVVLERCVVVNINE